MKKLYTGILILVSLVLLPSFSAASAAKPRIRKSTSVRGSVKPGISYSSARLSRSTNSVVVTFLNLDTVSRADYILSYVGSGNQQGVGGSIIPAGQASASRDLYFGTCSSGVCTAHTGIINATLTVTTSLKTGSTYTKRYRIKI